MEDENEIKHHFLLENFLLNGNINSFKKLLSLEPNKTIRNQTLNPHKSKQINSIALYKKLNPINYTTINNISSSINHTMNNNSINDIKKIKNYGNLILERHLDYADFREKCLKGNYESYSRKFNRIKINWAKRRGISIDNYEVPKVENYNKILDEKENNYSIMKNKKIIEALSNSHEFSQKRKEDFINTYNLKLNDNFILPNINLNNKNYRGIKIKFVK
jgi:hypothetical protein